MQLPSGLGPSVDAIDTSSRHVDKKTIYRHMLIDPKRPHNDLPILPPTAAVESVPVLKACIAARAALAELKATGALIPNQAVLINTIPLLEAQASSEIENIVTTCDALFRFATEDSAAADPATKEALRYRRALFRGFEAIRTRPLATNIAVEVCSVIKGTDMNVRRVAGVALASDARGTVVYAPPEGEDRLRRLLANWEVYLHAADGPDPLIRMAIQHYQFEAIHPFTDGNGRTGRILNLLYLVDRGLLDTPVLYLSQAIIARRADYYRLLLEVTQSGAWEPWIIYMLHAVTTTALWTTTRIRAIRNMLDEVGETIRQSAPKIYSRELAELIFALPYCRIQNVVEAGIAQRQSASVYLKKLVSIGVLEERKSGRERLFINPQFLKLLMRV
jgi:Fic family protein